MEKTTAPLAAAAAANLGIVRQACQKALAFCKCSHRLPSDAFSDLVGNVFVILISPREKTGIAPVDTFDPAKGSKFTSYLGVIAFRAAIDELEKATLRQGESLDATGGEEEEEEGTAKVDDLASAEPTAETAMLDAEQAVAFRAAVADLGASEFIAEDYSHEGYAATHGITVGAARVRYHRAMKAIREEIG